MDSNTQKTLQVEYDEILTLIKPLYLSWKNGQEKIILSNWIKKLSNMKSINVETLHLRNLYLLSIYDNLRKQHLHDTFRVNPPINDLMPLPNHLKQLIENFSVKSSFNPSWLETDTSAQKVNTSSILDNSLEYDDEDFIGDLKYSREQVNNLNHNYTHSLSHNNTTEYNSQNNGAFIVDTSNDSKQMSQSWSKNNNLTAYSLCNGIQSHSIYSTKSLTNNQEHISPITHSTGGVNDNDIFVTMSSRRDNLETMDSTDSKNKYSDSSILNKVQEKELLLNNISGMEKRLVQLQNAYHEDIMKLRQQHESEMQTIISRKNLEIENLHTEYKDKIEDQETQMKELELKATDCLKQLQMFQESKLKEINHIKKSTQDSLDNQMQQYEKKISTIYEDFQNEKQILQIEHKKREEVVAKETQDYFNKIKNEFSSKNCDTNRELMNLEKDLNDLRTSKTKVEETNGKLENEKQNLTVELNRLQVDLIDTQKKFQILEKEHNRYMSSHESEIKSLKENLETSLVKYESSRDEIEMKAKEKVGKIENQLHELQLKLKEAHRHHEIELDNVKFSNNVEKNRLKQTCDNELDNLKSQMKNIKLQMESKIQELEKKLDFKEIQLAQSSKEAEMKEKMANQMVEDIRQEMTHNNDRQLRKKQIEFELIETDLNKEIQEKNKEICDLMQQLSNHKEETEIKLADIRKWSDNQVTSLTHDWKQEKSQIEQQHQMAINQINQDNGQLIDTLKEDFKTQLSNIHDQNQSLKNDIDKLKSQYDAQIDQWNKEKTELLSRADEEKQNAIGLLKKELEDVNQKSLDHKFAMEKKHADNVSQILTKTNDKLKEIEEEYSSRSYQSFQLINELKSTVATMQEEKAEASKNNENQINTMTKKYNSEIENMQRVNKLNLETYKKDSYNLQTQIRQMEKQFERKRIEQDKQIYLLKSEHESKISKLLPIQVQLDYEETIKSLRSQISMLQQRVGLLEDEVVASTTKITNDFNKSSSRYSAYDQKDMLRTTANTVSNSYSNNINKKYEQIFEE